MTEEDLDGVLVIEGTLPGRIWTRKSFIDSLGRPESHFYTARLAENGQVAGYVCCVSALDESEIVNVAIARSLRGRGFGGILFAYVLEEQEKIGIRHFYLEVRQSNETAIALYKKEGFMICGIRKNFYEKPAEDAFTMALHLD